MQVVDNLEHHTVEVLKVFMGRPLGHYNCLGKTGSLLNASDASLITYSRNHLIKHVNWIMNALCPY